MINNRGADTIPGVSPYFDDRPWAGEQYQTLVDVRLDNLLIPAPGELRPQSRLFRARKALRMVGPTRRLPVFIARHASGSRTS